MHHAPVQFAAEHSRDVELRNEKKGWSNGKAVVLGLLRTRTFWAFLPLQSHAPSWYRPRFGCVIQK